MLTLCHSIGTSVSYFVVDSIMVKLSLHGEGKKKRISGKKEVCAKIQEEVTIYVFHIKWLILIRIYKIFQLLTISQNFCLKQTHGQMDYNLLDIDYLHGAIHLVNVTIQTTIRMDRNLVSQ